MSTRKQRSHNGCWTCKEKRKRCDGARPSCRNCQDREVLCGGYDLRLRWGVGIASRGRFTGADEPRIESVPARASGRQRDREKSRTHGEMNKSMATISMSTDVETHLIGSLEEASNDHEIGPETYQLQDPTLEAQLSKIIDDEQLFEQFLTSGIHSLHSTAVNDQEQMLASRVPALCTQSKALYAVCLALQTSLSDEHKPRFFEYFDAALSAFRVELDACISYLEDATWAAGLLLCSVCFIHGLPWTIHLHGMYAILRTHGFDDNSGQPNPFRAHLLEVMGVMDLPSFAVGRQTQCIGIWYRHCRGNMFYKYPNRDTVEHVSGLPRSLLDIFSGIDRGSEEEDFWAWPGAVGTLLQCQLWEAYRLAGMLTLRRRQSNPGLGNVESPRSFASTPSRTKSNSHNMVLPTTEVLVARILSSVDAIMRASANQESADDDLVVLAINYPSFVAGLETGILRSNNTWTKVIMNCFTEPRLIKSHGTENEFLFEVLQHLWQSDDDTANADGVARAQGRELGLL